MRRINLFVLLLATTGVLATGAFAQRYPSSRDPYYGGDRDPYYGRDRDRDPYSGNRGSYGSYQGGDPVDRAMRNLENAASMNRYDRHEREHFDKAIHELAKFQDRRRSGRFDQGALDKAMRNMEDLARANQLHPRARDIIARDLSELRTVRDYGGRNDPYYNRGRNGPFGRW